MEDEKVLIELSEEDNSLVGGLLVVGIISLQVGLLAGAYVANLVTNKVADKLSNKIVSYVEKRSNKNKVKGNE